MDTVERFENDMQREKSIYKKFTTKGFKRTLCLILAISVLNIFYVIFHKLSEGNMNDLFKRIISRIDTNLTNRNESYLV